MVVGRCPLYGDACDDKDVPLTGEKAYLDKMYDNWQYANSIMYDKETGLYFRDGKYVYPKHTTAADKKDFWARGDGWVLAAFAKVLADMDAAKAKRLSVKGKYRNEITKYYQRLAKAAINLQQQEGHWTRSMMDPDQAPGYETSGTALMCYALFWGINNGYLPMRYVQHAEKAWRYLETIALQPDNSIGYVQPIGEKAIPDRWWTRSLSPISAPEHSSSPHQNTSGSSRKNHN